MQLFFKKYTLIFFTLLLCFSSCSEGGDVTTEKDLNIWLKRDPAKLNPIVYPSSTAREVYQYILLPLADFHPETLKLEPVLIKKVPKGKVINEGKYKGGLSFTFEFREEAVWDDGKPITAHDYLFTIRAIKNPLVQAGGWRPLLEDLTSVVIDVDNPKKFEVIVKEPYMLALEAIASVNLYPAHIYDPQRAMEKYSLADLHSAEAATEIAKDSMAVQFANDMNSAKHTREIVRGSGPYELTQWESDQYIILTKQENYWGNEFKNSPSLQGSIERIVFKIIKDENAAVGLLKSGALHTAGGLSSAVFEDIKNDPASKGKFNFFNPQLIKQYYMLLNNEDVVLKDVKVRKALGHVTDVSQMIANFENGLGERQSGPFHSTKAYLHKELKPIAYDLDQARKLLDEGAWIDSDDDGVRDKMIEGKKQDLEISILISKRELGKKISLMIQEAAQKVGIKINLETQANATISQRKKSGEFQLVTAVNIQEAIDDDPYNKWHSKGARNQSNYSNPRIDALIDEIRNTIEPSAREKLYLEFQEIFYEEAPAIFLYSPKERIICSSALNAKGSSKRPGYMANTFSFK